MNHFYHCDVRILADVIVYKFLKRKPVVIEAQTYFSKKIKASCKEEALEKFQDILKDLESNVDHEYDGTKSCKIVYKPITTDLISDLCRNNFVNEFKPMCIENVRTEEPRAIELTHKEACKYFTTEDIFGKE